MKITTQWLQQYSIPTSYERGESYYHSVKKITQYDNIFKAVVSGTKNYQVTIELGKFDANCHCSCPYDYEGLCKHIVAVGLNIVDGNFQQGTLKEAKPAEKPSFQPVVSPITPVDFYKDTFKKAAPEHQEAFLRQLFSKEKKWQQAFLSFLQDVSRVSKIKGMETDDFDLFKQRTLQCLGTRSTDRQSYRRICQALLPIMEISGIVEERRRFIKDLKKKYNRWPAFLDELRKAGF